MPPKAEPAVTPMMCGSTSGFWNTPCKVAPHSPSAVERLRRIRPGINMMASSSRQRSLKNAALPMTGPKDSVSKIPESEYQPKPLAIARPVFNGRPRIKAFKYPAE